MNRCLPRHLWTLPLLAAALALVPAAASKDVIGKFESSWIVNCSSQVNGNPFVEKGVNAWAGFIYGSALPKVGETFYGAANFGAAGEPCVVQSASVEVVLPVGVTLAITPKTPVRCSVRTFDVKTRTVSDPKPAQGCPRRPSKGLYGLRFSRATGKGGRW